LLLIVSLTLLPLGGEFFAIEAAGLGERLSVIFNGFY